MSTIGMVRLQDGVATSAETASLTITDVYGGTVVSPVTVTPASAGVYSYDVSLLPVGVYTATWTFSIEDFEDEVIVRTFNIDAATVTTEGYRLMDIERGLGQRVGPYRRIQAAAGSSESVFSVRSLRSSIASMAELEELFILRRGRYRDDSLVVNFDPDDRVRRVASFDPSTGILEPDLAWTIAPAVDEDAELHYLDPEHELRVAVLEGLKRCYFWDTASVATTTYLREINLTYSVPWVTRSRQVRRIDYGRLGYTPNRAPWFETYQSGRSVMLKTAIPNLGTMRVKALRSHFTFVNGEYSAVGPDQDGDILSIDWRYATIAVHNAAWEFFPVRLFDASKMGMKAPQQAVANAFTVLSRAILDEEPEIINNRFGQEDILDNLQVGNG